MISRVYQPIHNRYNRKIITRNDNIFAATFVSLGNAVTSSGISNSMIEKTIGRIFIGQLARYISVLAPII